ncbi:16S rRNA (uracil(1498)-N(3))-methyltransferase [Agromyces archimandritae]|uniref:Ribosomal RNA small subunit methyltransferase E n=1 Tax=Agromyces archimandritae TaxID=2781962 RepID=A0A975FMJ6_9MICO|nr:16S rRNA (uracil(1498)-N(3))-methyltransferase [Agromyces archimandritae]QTX04869.1 16S rRNA (uracil(1498)-N(3))-methyltransferase [Agromyces archimandritae]
MANLYLDESLGDGIRPGDAVELAGDEARHAATVARIRVGEQVAIGDGRGTIVDGVVESVEPKRLTVRVVSVRRVDAPGTRIVLVQALAKGGRDELAVQAATELGVDEIVPWAARRSVSRWEGPKAAKGRERWASIAREATKQSMRAWMPEVHPVASTHELPALLAGRRVLLLEPTASAPLAGLEPDGRELVLVVGPEGGIDPGELEALGAAGAEAVRLGPEVLRTSTAGPAAIAVLAARLGRW